jgi:hypothetical protein
MTPNCGKHPSTGSGYFFVTVYQFLVDKVLDFRFKVSSPFPARFKPCVEEDELLSLELEDRTPVGIFPN